MDVFSWGVAKLVKATDFDSVMRRFESYLPSQTVDSGGPKVDGCY